MQKERSADLKIYYDGRQCRGDPFKIRGTLKWDASKFNAQDRFVFKDADYPYGGVRPQECEITGVVTRIWAIYFRYVVYRQRCGQVLRPSEYKILQISRSDAYEPKFEGFEFGAYLVQLRDTDCENLPE